MERVFDVYDDGGAILRHRTLDAELPDWVKEASYPEDAPDDLFALVVDGERPLRKFACDTPANTVLSMLYFRDTSHQLGPKLEKAAAQRLVEACGWYGLRVPADLQKKADVSGSELAPRSGTPKAESEMKQQKLLGLQAVKQTKCSADEDYRPAVGVGAAGGTVAGGAAGALVGRRAGERAVQQTLKESPWLRAAHHTKLIKDIRATKTRKGMLRGGAIGVGTGLAGGAILGAAAKRLFGRKQTKEASLYADPANRRYPLDAIDDVADANRYMDKYASEFDPRTRRTIAFNIFKRSCDLFIQPGKAVREIVLRKVASASSVRGHLEARATFYGRDTEGGILCQALMSKVGSLHPEVMAETIAQLDAKCGGDAYWNSHIPEPWDVVYEKTANEGPADYSYDFGTWKVSGSDLVRLAKTSKHVDARFGREFAEQFRADPIQFFDHLPRPEKEVLGRMAQDVWTSGSNIMTGAQASR